MRVGQDAGLEAQVLLLQAQAHVGPANHVVQRGVQRQFDQRLGRRVGDGLARSQFRAAIAAQPVGIRQRPGRVAAIGAEAMT